MMKAFKQYFQEPQETAQGNESNYDDDDCGADEDHVVVNTSKIEVDSTALFRPHYTAGGPRTYTVRGCVTLLSSAHHIVQKIRSSSEVNLSS